MNVLPPIYIPTWPTDEFDLLLNITKSPACKFDFETAVPFDACAPDVLLILIPKCLYTYDVNPEQSKPVSGDEPPDTYLYPKYFFAYSTIPLPVAPELDVLEELAWDDVVLLSVFSLLSFGFSLLLLEVVATVAVSAVVSVLLLEICSLLDVTSTFLSDKYLLAT